MAENCRFCFDPSPHPARESREVLGFPIRSPPKRKSPPNQVRRACFCKRRKWLAEGGDTLCEPRKFPRRRVLVEHALGHAAGELGLDLLDRRERLLLVAG